MSKVIATDIPKWLQQIIKKFKYENLGMIQKSLITAYLQNLPNKFDGYDIAMCDTNVPQDFLDKFNRIDYAKISSNEKKKMQEFITNYVKSNNLI